MFRLQNEGINLETLQPVVPVKASNEMKKLAIFLSLLTLPLMACAEDVAPAKATNPFTAGKHFTVLEAPQPTSVSDGMVEVVEIFWYGCPHCYHLEPEVAKWLENKPAKAAFVRMPAPLNPSWEKHARMYYTADALGVLDDVHSKIFASIHVERNRLATESQARAFFEKNGVTANKFKSAYRSFGVDSQMARTKQLVAGYKLRSVPTFVVAGKYLITATSAGGNNKIFEVVNALVAQEAQ
ncbi:MAG: thiol:disulfide interchange protein DsbA [Gammaproteobacteria bacterium]|jgi:thiol:disulfide interchange protein DsbA